VYNRYKKIDRTTIKETVAQADEVTEQHSFLLLLYSIKRGHANPATRRILYY